MDSAQDTREFAMVDLYVRYCNNLEDTMPLDFSFHLALSVNIEMDSAQDTREFAMVDLYVRYCNNLEDTMPLDFDEILPRASENNTFLKPAVTESYYSGFDTVNVPIQVPNATGYTSVPDIPEQEISGDDVVNSLLDLDQVFYENSSGPQSLDDKPHQHLQTSDFFPKYDTQFNDDENVTWNNFNMEDILISRAIQDIYNEANGLGINCNPKLWSQADANRWIDWTCNKLGKQQPNMDYFNMNGDELCSMSESEFEQKCPESGKLLCSQLELWLNVSRSTPSCNIPRPVLDESLYTETYGDCLPCVSPSPSDSSDHSICNSPLNTREETFTYKNRPKTTYSRSGVHEHKQTIHLWQFLKELLNQSEQFSNCIKWIDRSKGIFKIEDSTRVAKEWGKRKNRPAMNYDKLSRSIRQYYRKGIIKKTEHSKRLVYQFCTPYL